MNRLYKDKEDFMAAVDRGVAMVTAELPAPHESHQQDLKALLAVFITATISMDPDSMNSSMNSPEFDVKLSSVRMALLAAYNLGKQNA